MEDFWRKSLEGCEAAPFPSLPSSIDIPRATAKVEYQFSDTRFLDSSYDVSVLIGAAWGLITGSLTDSHDVVFGLTTSSTKTLMPVRVQLIDDQSVNDFKDQLQTQTTKSSLASQLGLDEIAKLSTDCEQACSFQTVIIIQHSGTESQMQQFSGYGLTIELAINGSQINAFALFDPRVVESKLTLQLLQRLEFVMLQLSNAPPGMPLKEIELVSPRDLDLIGEWNSLVPDVIERCIHDVINDRVLADPSAQAICAWDGEMTYLELDNISSKVARYLSELGIGPEIVVPLCFEKSMWTVVAMFSVLKAGGAFILLDPALPQARIQTICQKVNATVGITSIVCKARLSPVISHTIALCRETIEPLSSRQDVTLLPSAKPHPRNAAYIIFTSGSTGEPKGCVIEHQSYTSAAFGHGRVQGMDNSTRALQFGSYNFAQAIVDIIMTLIYGGCVCIPSEEDRVGNLANAIVKLNANWAFVTSTVLAVLHPEQVPCLRTVCCGGEPIRSAQIKEWASKVHFRQTYGSAETSAVVASAKLYETSTVTGVGKPTTAKCWLVDPANINKLVPVGAPGEIVFEGPTIGREYVGNTEKSLQTFITAPPWREQFGSRVESSRFYRTGDVATYRSDGSIELLGRKDTQVKLKGQRIELGEIEHQVRLSSSDIKGVAVELTTLSTASKGPALICFLVLASTESSTVASNETQTRSSKEVVQTIREHLVKVLPYYMVPSVFLPLSALPLTISGKMDRRRLREKGSALTSQEILGLQSVAGDKSSPTTLIEQQLRDIWSKSLKLEKDAIGLGDSFFQLGGDSISAMEVVTEARKVGMKMVMADLFRNDTISRLAGLQSQHMEELALNELSNDNHAALIEPSAKRALLEEIDSKYPTVLRPNDVEGIYPLTGVQEILIAAGAAAEHRADFFYLDISDKIDVSDLERGCRGSLRKFPILRALWLPLQGKYWQVVRRHVDQPLCTVTATGDFETFFEEYCIEDLKSISPTEPTHKWILLKRDSPGSMRLIFRGSHAQYDAYSVPLILQSVFDNIDHDEVPAQEPSFEKFLSYASNRRSPSIEYWSRILKGARTTLIVPSIAPPLEKRDPMPSIIGTKSEARLSLQRAKGTTSATLVRTAWAMLLSHLTNTSDITFGHIISGRNAAIPAVDKIVGCCLNIVPERVKLSSFETVAQVLQASQEQVFLMGDADTLSCNDILSECTDWPAGTSFDSVLHHRDVDANPEVHTPEGITRMQVLNKPLLSPFIFVVSYTTVDKINVEIWANTYLMTPEMGQTLIDNLAIVIETLDANPEMSVTTFMAEVKTLLSKDT